MANRLITTDEFIADIFIHAWENGIDERVAFWAVAGMLENPFAAGELQKLAGEGVL